MERYQLSITKCWVTKHRVGEASTINPRLHSEFFFKAHYEFNTGSCFEINMGIPRKEYEAIPTLEINFEDKEIATDRAFEDYKNAVKLISDERFVYARDKKNYCSIYGKDDTSPTGVILLGGVSNHRLADFVIRKLGKIGTSLSPTEDMRSAR